MEFSIVNSNKEITKDSCYYKSLDWDPSSYAVATACALCSTQWVDALSCMCVQTGRYLMLKTLLFVTSCFRLFIITNQAIVEIGTTIGHAHDRVKLSNQNCIDNSWVVIFFAIKQWEEKKKNWVLSPILDLQLWKLLPLYSFWSNIAKS